MRSTGTFSVDTAGYAETPKKTDDSRSEILYRPDAPANALPTVSKCGDSNDFTTATGKMRIRTSQ